MCLSSSFEAKMNHSFLVIVLSSQLKTPLITTSGQDEYEVLPALG